MTVKWLSKPQEGSQPDKSRIIVCTGERMESLITKIYKTQGVQTTTFEPVHSKGLSNEFLCYANFESENWKWKRPATSSWFSKVPPPLSMMRKRLDSPLSNPGVFCLYIGISNAGKCMVSAMLLVRLSFYPVILIYRTLPGTPICIWNNDESTYANDWMT